MHLASQVTGTNNKGVGYLLHSERMVVAYLQESVWLPAKRSTKTLFYIVSK